MMQRPTLLALPFCLTLGCDIGFVEMPDLAGSQSDGMEMATLVPKIFEPTFTLKTQNQTPTAQIIKVNDSTTACPTNFNLTTGIKATTMPICKTGSIAYQIECIYTMSKPTDIGQFSKLAITYNEIQNLPFNKRSSGNFDSIVMSWAAVSFYTQLDILRHVSLNTILHDNQPNPALQKSLIIDNPKLINEISFTINTTCTAINPNMKPNQFIATEDTLNWEITGLKFSLIK